MKKGRFILSGMLMVLLISFDSVMAQNMVAIHDTIESEILKEKRLIDVMLPEKYNQNPDIRYDVIYVLDGEWSTKLVSQIYDFLAHWGLVPENIIVSIPHNNLQGINLREIDLVPRHDGQPVSGKADNFLSFLKNELIPYINRTYPTTSKNTLYGHSLGGSFALYALLTEPQLFETYIASDPALWFDNYFICMLASDKLNDIPDDKALFMSGKGGREFREMGVFFMDSIITAEKPLGLHFKCVDYLDETHRTVPLKTIYDGLRFTYNGYGAVIGFNPNSGIILKNKPLKIMQEDETAGFNIRYTTDGSEPTDTSPKFQGLDITEPTNLKIRLFSATGRYDQTVSGNFESGNLLHALSAPGNIKPGGLHFTNYKGKWSSLPEFNKLNPDSSGYTGYVKEDYGILNLPNQNNGACLVEGYLEIKEDGYYAFGMGADDIAKLYFNDKLIIALDQKKEGQTYMLPLEKGFYAFRMECIVKKGGRGLSFTFYKQPDKWVWKPIPSELLYSDEKYSSK